MMKSVSIPSHSIILLALSVCFVRLSCTRKVFKNFATQSYETGHFNTIWSNSAVNRSIAATVFGRSNVGWTAGHSRSIKIGDFVKSLDHTMYFFIDQLRSNKMFCRSYLRYRNHSNHIQCIQKSLLMHKIMVVVVKSGLWRSKLTSDIFSARWWSKNLLIPIPLLFCVNHGYFSTLYFLITNISQSSLGIGQGNLLGVLTKIQQTNSL